MFKKIKKKTEKKKKVPTLPTMKNLGQSTTNI